MAVTLYRTGTARRLNIDIAEHDAGIDPHRGDVGDMDGMLAAAEPVRRVMDDGGWGDLDLRRKQVVPRAQAARAEDMARREWPSFAPDDEEEQDRDSRDNQRRDHRRGLKVELLHERRMLS